MALTWARTELAQWGVFVANRVAKFQELTLSQQWLHVPREQTHADLATRISQALLEILKLWWHGPEWLQDPHYWVPQSLLNKGLQPDLKCQLATSALLQDDLPARLLPIDRISDYARLLKVIKLVLTFLHVKTPSVHRLVVVKFVQQEQTRYNYNFYNKVAVSLRRIGSNGFDLLITTTAPCALGAGLQTPTSRKTLSVPSCPRQPNYRWRV